MKAFAIVVIAMLLPAGFVLLGCSKEESPRPPAPAAEQPAQKAPEAPAELPDETQEAGATTEPPAAAAPPEAKAVAAPLLEKVPTPWSDATVGTMVRMKGMGGVTLTQEVIRVDDATVTLRMSTSTPALAEPVTTETEMPRYAPPGASSGTPAGAGLKVGTEKLTIAGQELLAEVWENKVTAEGKTITIRTYISKEVPGWVAKVESDAMGEMATIQQVVGYKK